MWQHAWGERKDSAIVEIKETSVDEAGNISRRKLGTVFGVFFPCVQNILGVILFMRLTWIVGNVGVLFTILMVLTCTTATFLTTLSMSAIATNAKSYTGGTYWMISHCLGKPFGGAVGILFYLGTTFSCSMYCLGAIETLVVAFPELKVVADPLNNTRILGVILLLLLFLIVFFGVRQVSRVAVLFLIPVALGILFIWVGVFTNMELKKEILVENLYPAPGMSFPEWASYLSILFPGLTGIMAGNNRSGDLRDPSHSIPVGTLSAIGVTSLFYLSFILLFASILSPSALANNPNIVADIGWPAPILIHITIFLSATGAALQCLCGAPRVLNALSQDLCQGPFPWLKYIYQKNKEPRICLAVTLFPSAILIIAGNINAVAPLVTMTFGLCYCFVNIACLIMSVSQSPSWRPSWRFYHWSAAAVGILVCCFIMWADEQVWATVAFVSFVILAWYIDYKLVQRDWGGEGVTGMKLNMSTKYILELSGAPSSGKVKPHWRPQLLLPLLVDMQEVDIDTKMIEVSSTLLMSSGFTQLVGLVHSRTKHAKRNNMQHPVWVESFENIKAKLHKAVEKMNERSTCCVVDCHDMTLVEALSVVVQSIGIGVLSPNIMMIRWPDEWKADLDRARTTGVFPSSIQWFDACLQCCLKQKKAALVMFGLDLWPGCNQFMRGTIDIWWAFQDGGIMMLLASFLARTRRFANCSIRLFIISFPHENSLLLKRQAAKFLEEVRIDAEVTVVEYEEHYGFGPEVHTTSLDLAQRECLMRRLAETAPDQAVSTDLNVPVKQIDRILSIPRRTSTETKSNVGEKEHKESELPPASEEMTNPEEQIAFAMRVNKLIVERSLDCAVVFVRLPDVMLYNGHKYVWSASFLGIVELLCDGLQRAVLVRGTGDEVVF